MNESNIKLSPHSFLSVADALRIIWVTSWVTQHGLRSQGVLRTGGRAHLNQEEEIQRCWLGGLRAAAETRVMAGPDKQEVVLMVGSQYLSRLMGGYVCGDPPALHKFHHEGTCWPWNQKARSHFVLGSPASLWQTSLGTPVGAVHGY